MTGLPLFRPDAVLRPASPADVGAMAAMINRYAARGLMLPKSPAELCRTFREYVVFSGPEGRVIACGGLRVYSPQLSELVGLAVDEEWQGRGLGPAIVAHLLEEARRLGLARVFAMALDEGFYHRLGFRTVARDGVPEKVEGDCRSCPRRVGCREVAVLVDLAPTAAAAPRAARAGRARRELRVLPGIAGAAARAGIALGAGGA